MKLKKMKLKKILAILLALTLVVSFAACSKGDSEEPNVLYLGNEDIDFENIFSQTDEIDASEIYKSINYNEKMLYGTYALNNEEKDVKDVRKNIPFSDVEFLDGSTFNISVLPISVSSGVEYICDNLRAYIYDDFKEVSDKELAVLQFPTEDDIGTVICSYEVNGNKVTYQTLEQTSETGEKLEYVNDLPKFEYEFSISGPYLTLSNGSESITLTGFSFTEDNETGYEMLSAYSLEDSPLIDDLDYMSLSNEYINYAVDRQGNYYEEAAAKISDDGIISIYLKAYNEDPVIKQFAYILNCSGVSYFNSFSIMLFDGEKEYYYTDSITSREARQLPDTDLDDDQIKEIAEKKEDLYTDLKTEFENEGINATINRATGEIMLDTTVLFGGDSAVVSSEGKEFLNKFVKAYTNIIYNEKYDGFISKTVIEGHIAPISGTTYESGLPLSTQRAENVKEYILSGDTGVDTTKLSSSLETVGYSQSKPIYDSNGDIDIEASRRVSFRFVVNVEK